MDLSWVPARALDFCLYIPANVENNKYVLFRENKMETLRRCVFFGADAGGGAARWLRKIFWAP